MIKRIISNPNRKHRGLVRELTNITYLEAKDILHELYITFIEKHRDKEINHLPTYLDRFCFTTLMNMKKYYNQEKRAEERFQFEQYNEQCSYGGCNQEEIISEIIDKNR